MNDRIPRSDEILYRAVCSRKPENGASRIFPAGMDQWGAVSCFFSHWAKENGCPASCALLMEMALEELFTNTVSYGYPRGNGSILILLSRSREGAFEVTLADCGVPFDPTALEEPDLKLPVEDRPVGGLGIHMVKKFMDRTEYRRYCGCNIFTFSKSADLRKEDTP